MTWIVEFATEKVRADLDAMPRGIRASFERIATLVESHGLLALREPYAKHLDGKLWELRMKGPEGIARAAFILVHQERFVVVHVFRKKTQKTPRRDIEIAMRRAKEFKP